MKKTLIYIALGSLILNAYYNATWIYSYLNTKTHHDAVLKFRRFFPSFISPAELLLLLLSLGSVFIFSNFKTTSNHYLYTSGIIIQGIFMLLNLWQLL